MNFDFFFKAPQEIVVSSILNIFIASFIFFENFSSGGLFPVLMLLIILLVIGISIFLFNLSNIARKLMLILVEVALGLSVLLFFYFMIYYNINNLILILLILVYGPYEIYLLGYNPEILQAYKK